MEGRVDTPRPPLNPLCLRLRIHRLAYPVRPAHMTGRVIGPRGAIVQDLQRRSGGARIRVMSGEGAGAGAAAATVVIEGAAEAVALAEQLVRGILEGEVSGYGEGGKTGGDGGNRDGV